MKHVGFVHIQLIEEKEFSKFQTTPHPLKKTLTQIEIQSAYCDLCSKYFIGELLVKTSAARIVALPRNSLCVPNTLITWWCFNFFRMVRDKLFKGDFSYNMKLLQVTVLFYILNK